MEIAGLTDYSPTEPAKEGLISERQHRAVAWSEILVPCPGIEPG